MSLLLLFQGQSVAPPISVKAAFLGAALDIDFTTNTVLKGLPGLTTIAEIMSRPGGLTIDSSGLLMNDNIATSQAFRTLMQDESASYLIEYDGAEGRYGGHLLGEGGPRIDVPDSGVMSHQLFNHRDYSGPKSLGPIDQVGDFDSGSLQRIVYAWDASLPSGQRGYASTSGGAIAYDTDTGVLSRYDANRFAYVGSRDGTLDGDAVASAAYPSPKMRRLVIWSTALTPLQVHDYAVRTYEPPAQVQNAIYKGSKARASIYRGLKSDAQIYKGGRILFPS